jgi:ATP/maltotriose-dependent transcriptional regulator MalT
VRVGGELERGRTAFARGAWADACDSLLAADGAAPLDLDDLERLAQAHFMLGQDAGCAEALTRAHHECLRQDDLARAARCAFWLGFWQDMTGQEARAAGWFERARRLVDEMGGDCAERGYVLLPGALEALMVRGDGEAARAEFEEIAEIGDRFGDRDLATFARLGWGHALVVVGERSAGMAMLDEIMVAVTTGEVTPHLAGLVYCAVIGVCHDIFDLRRAREWTEALSTWCASQPDLVVYRGACLVHRAEIMQLDGTWSEAMAETRRAYDLLTQVPGQMAVGEACYQRGELHRLQGEVDEAEDAYRQSSHWGRPPQPGLALLRLSQGRTDAAAKAIRRATDEADDPISRSKLLAALAEVSLAAGDVVAARAAAAELGGIAADFQAPFLRAGADQATGAVLLAEADARAALASLRRAQTVWHELGAPYEVARTRVLIGLACRALGDADGEALELDAALSTFQQLGARTDAARVQRLVASGATPVASILSPRELEVLGLLATGMTNRKIAAELVISDKTVARHVSNIFAKLGVSSRAAATAYAYEHDLVEPSYTE